MIARADLEKHLDFLKYELALREAEDDLIRFAEVTMPDQKLLDEVAATRYDAADHHRYMAELMMRVEAGEKKKVILNLPPRHGKSELCTKRFAAWYHGRNPQDDIIVATYNEKFANDFGKEIREIVTSERFRQIFPDYYLTTQSNEMVTNYAGGKMYFLGRRSATTGRGGNLILVDDPTKDDKEVKSDLFREDCWQWFTQTLLTRRHNDKSAIVVTQTRWHEDDIVGRITDKTNPAYSPKFAAGFEVINLAAIAGPDDPLKRKPGTPLWPTRFGIEYLEEMQEANSVSFAALYQCDPTPDDGVFYRQEELHEYDLIDLPSRMTFYAASDHAVGTRAVNDPTCMVPFGICENDIAWVLPDVSWRRMDTKEAVEEMIGIIKTRKPVFWYAEKGHISKAIGPFLQARLKEEEVYCPIIEDHPTADKIQRAQSGRARAAQGRIRFPRFAPWWPRAKSELLKFPNGRFDDFVDVVSTIGMKLATHTGPGRASVAEKKYGPGTYGHLLRQFKVDDMMEKSKVARAGW